MSTGMLVAFAAVFGMVILLVPLIIWFNRRNAGKYAQLWPPLAAKVNGTFKGRSMTGSYGGMPVQARINTVSDDSSTEYFYELTLTSAAHGRDWTVTYGSDKLFGMGQKGWLVKARDESLKQRLTDAGTVDLVQGGEGHPEVSYKAKHGVLKYEQRVGGMFALPTAEQFDRQLDLLARLAQINQQVNMTA